MKYLVYLKRKPGEVLEFDSLSAEIEFVIDGEDTILRIQTPDFTLDLFLLPSRL